MYFAIELSSRENLFRCARARAHLCARIAHGAHFCALIQQGAHSLLRGPILASWICHLGFRSNISKKLRIREIYARMLYGVCNFVNFCNLMKKTRIIQNYVIKVFFGQNICVRRIVYSRINFHCIY